jgi:hypothetical protein
MKFLIDTNIFIPLEPTSTENLSFMTPDATRLAQIIQTAGHQIYLHPHQKHDIKRDSDPARKKLREALFEKYPVIPTAPSIPVELLIIIGTPKKESNDWVDNHLIVALYRDAVDYLVTEDKRLRNKAERLSLQGRVLTLAEALNIVEILFDEVTVAPPAIKSAPAYELDDTDPFFDSFREDYSHKGFSDWFQRCKREHRQSWFIENKNGSKYAAAALINQEKMELTEIAGRKLKICSFKVAAQHSGYHYSELLLKTIFEYAAGNSYDWLYITAFPKYDMLINLLKEFGFEELQGKTSRGEIRLLKSLKYKLNDLASLSPLEFLRRFGPFTFRLNKIPAFIVPIQPQYNSILFPDSEMSQPDLFPGILPFGNSIRKVYLSNAGIRSTAPGDLLLFYTSKCLKAVSNLGIVEKTVVTRNPDEVVKNVGKRTVYSFSEVSGLCKKNEVLVILFWHCGILNKPISYNELKRKGVLSGPPQSIQHINEEKRDWLDKELIARLPFYQSSPSS